MMSEPTEIGNTRRLAMNSVNFRTVLFGTGLMILIIAAPGRGNAQASSLYNSKCSVCHGAGGKGDTPAGKSMGVPDLTKSGKSAAELRGIIEKGRNKMPAYGKSLKAQEIDGLVAYIKSLK